MDRTLADHRLWQFADVRVEVEADAFVSVEPFLPADMRVERVGDRFVIHGMYGFDLFTDHAFTVRIGDELQVFSRLEDIPEVYDNVISFLPDETHDITFSYTFVKDGVTFQHHHWIHHDMEPWNGILRELVARESFKGTSGTMERRVLPGQVED